MQKSHFTWKLTIPSILLVFFMFIGFLETGILGIPAGFITYGICSLTLPLGLIPFIGFFLWYTTVFSLLDNFSKFLNISTMREKALLIYGIQTAIYCALTSILTILLIYVVLKYWKYRKKIKQSLFLYDSLTFLKQLFYEIPVEKWKQILEKIRNMEKKINKKLFGSVLFWFGLGLACHDFYWESKKNGDEIDVERPTHGVYTGLGITTMGINIIQASITKNLLHHLGVGFCYFAFYLLFILPKGLSRIISHFFWWSGCGLMTFHWYSLMKDELIKEKIAYDLNLVKKVIKE